MSIFRQSAKVVPSTPRTNILNIENERSNTYSLPAFFQWYNKNQNEIYSILAVELLDMNGKEVVSGVIQRVECEADHRNSKITINHTKYGYPEIRYIRFIGVVPRDKQSIVYSIGQYGSFTSIGGRKSRRTKTRKHKRRDLRMRRFLTRRPRKTIAFRR